MYWISRYLDPWPWPIFHAPVTYTFYVNVPLSLGCMIWKVSAEDIAIRGNGTGLEYMCPTRHFVYIFFNPVFRLSTAKNEINLFNNHVLIVAPVTFAPAGAMTPSAEFLSYFVQKICIYISCSCLKLSSFLEKISKIFPFLKKWVKYFKMLSAEIFTQHAMCGLF